jgi:hypothetical protein
MDQSGPQLPWALLERCIGLWVALLLGLSFLPLRPEGGSSQTLTITDWEGHCPKPHAGLTNSASPGEMEGRTDAFQQCLPQYGLFQNTVRSHFTQLTHQFRSSSSEYKYVGGT